MAGTWPAAPLINVYTSGIRRYSSSACSESLFFGLFCCTLLTFAALSCFGCKELYLWYHADSFSLYPKVSFINECIFNFSEKFACLWWRVYNCFYVITKNPHTLKHIQQSVFYSMFLPKIVNSETPDKTGLLWKMLTEYRCTNLIPDSYSIEFHWKARECKMRDDDDDRSFYGTFS